MKIYTLFFLAVGLSSFVAPTDHPKSSFPEPPITENHLFYIQRSNDANTVMYEANVLPDKHLDTELPINVYWIRYAEKGQKEKLSAIQWQLAYGYKQHLNKNENNSIEISLNSFRDRTLHVFYHEGRPVASTQINGHRSLLKKIFVQLASTNGFIPKVRYIELYGVDMGAKNQPVSERIYIQ